MRTRVGMALTLAVIAMGFLALGARRPAHGGALRLPTDSPISSLDPLRMHWPAEIALASAIYDSPYKLGFSGRPLPHLLRPVASIGKGRTFRFKVYTHAVFHDGRPVRASHVVDSLQRLAKSRDHGWLLASVDGTPSSTKGLKGISLIGTNTVQIKMRSLRDLNLLVMALSTVHASVVPSARKAARGIGTGPFMLRGTKGSHRLRANRDYFGGPPFLSELTFLGPTKRVEHIRRFQLEQADASWLGDSAYGEEAPIKGVSLAQGAPRQLLYLLFNTSRGAAGDLPFRRAVDLAIDRHRLRTIDGEPIGFPGSSRPTASEPRRARSLFAGLGLDNRSRPVVLLVDEADALSQMAAPLVQRDLSAVGLTVNLVVASPRETRTRLSAGTWDMRLQTLAPLSPNKILQLGQILAHGGLRAEARRLMKGASRRERDEIRRALSALRSQLPLIPLCRRRARLHFRSYYRGITFDSIGRLPLADVWRHPSGSR